MQIGSGEQNLNNNNYVLGMLSTGLKPSQAVMTSRELRRRAERLERRQQRNQLRRCND